MVFIFLGMSSVWECRLFNNKIKVILIKFLKFIHIISCKYIINRMNKNSCEATDYSFYIHTACILLNIVYLTVHKYKPWLRIILSRPMLWLFNILKNHIPWYIVTIHNVKMNLFHPFYSLSLFNRHRRFWVINWHALLVSLKMYIT